MRFLTTGEIAERLEVTIPTVKRWIREGHLTAFRTAGGHYRVTGEAVARFEARQGIPSSVKEPLRILVVDDDPRFLETVAEVLQLEPRFCVETAQDGYEGLIKIGAFRPDLLVLDLRMPRLDGFEVCRKVKGNPITKGTKILAITGYVGGSVRARILRAGADGHLAKPFRLEQLQARVGRLLGVAAGFGPGALSLSLGAERVGESPEDQQHSAVSGDGGRDVSPDEGPASPEQSGPRSGRRDRVIRARAATQS
jgi:excisionase family DNA binding protein